MTSMFSRSQLQQIIDDIRGSKTIALDALVPLMRSRLDDFDLSKDDLTHDFMKEHILTDLINYQGVTK